MKFKEKYLEDINISNIESFKKIIIEYLCGKSLIDEKDENDSELLERLLEKAKSDGLNYEQFNEALLLLNQDRVSRSFFYFFFKGILLKEKEEEKNEKITLDELKIGIINFRGYAMLCFGNFSFAYNQLTKKDFDEFKKLIKQYCDCSANLKKIFLDRPYQMLDINLINKQDTFYTGYLIRDEINHFFNKTLPEIEDDSNLKNYIEEAKKERIKLNRISEIAIKNTKTYLTWDYMDIYIATSMRNIWEFDDCYEFIKNLFNNKELNNLKLRYFDPTQCFLYSRIDKSLVEGLMLKRAKCCIYMVQESDTLGKDSELASTLAQGKPVIAYIPKIDFDIHSKKISNYPYEYFVKRLQILEAEDIFTNDKEIEELIPHYSKVIAHFFNEVEKLEKEFKKMRSKNEKLVKIFFWKKEKKQEFINDFKTKNPLEFEKLCKIICSAESINFNMRANTLINYHPLSLQVDLNTGVANGLLVVREINKCAELLKKILLNDLHFEIIDMSNRMVNKENCFALIEDISESPFRVVTKDKKLTNSFWNFYLNK